MRRASASAKLGKRHREAPCETANALTDPVRLTEMQAFWADALRVLPANAVQRVLEAAYGSAFAVPTDVARNTALALAKVIVDVDGTAHAAKFAHALQAEVAVP